MLGMISFCISVVFLFLFYAQTKTINRLFKLVLSRTSGYEIGTLLPMDRVILEAKSSSISVPLENIRIVIFGSAGCKKCLNLLKEIARSNHLQDQILIVYLSTDENGGKYALEGEAEKLQFVIIDKSLKNNLKLDAYPFFYFINDEKYIENKGLVESYKDLLTMYERSKNYF
ncbi:thioredoxin family protein [Paenibacillus sp. ISL-20]|uniref:thioredoxin family protein n=1 Tax=Paenibacillus sp. ISL-20 TaxID=2819163 RepID=UPI001BE70B56|nr:thioredoxin family protein [Paenibacillus sp. ISL-20]MBT2762675.1 hypothetical protein [Paenibacillus sp. ISL-20]